MKEIARRWTKLKFAKHDKKETFPGGPSDKKYFSLSAVLTEVEINYYYYYY